MTDHMPEIRQAAERLHDEAHADDKTPFRVCLRPTCKDLLQALDEHGWCTNG